MNKVIWVAVIGLMCAALPTAAAVRAVYERESNVNYEVKDQECLEAIASAHQILPPPVFN